MRERLLIVGTGELGREILAWALQVPANLRTWEVGGFLDEPPGHLGSGPWPAPLLGSPLTHVFAESDLVIVALANLTERREMVRLLTARGTRFTSIIHPSAIFGLNNTWGVGCVFFPGAILTTNVRLGDHVILHSYSGVGHDVEIGNYCTLQPGAQIVGRSRVADGVLLGICAGVMPGLQIGEGASIGSGSIVMADLAARTSVVGVPAREVAGSPASGTPAV
jgi:sugar O-acyltransferase (sialic acid O-acetyltransferase NeuD family)